MRHRKVGLNGGSHSLYNPIITDSPFHPRFNVAEENAGNVASCITMTSVFIFPRGPLETLRSSRTCVMGHEWRMRADGTRVARAECVLYALRFVRTVCVPYAHGHPT